MVLTVGSIVASVSFMSASVDSSASQSATKGIEYQSLERQRVGVNESIEELRDLATRYKRENLLTKSRATIREISKQSDRLEGIELQQAANVRDIPKPSAGLLGWFLGAGIMLEILALLSVAIFKGVK